MVVTLQGARRLLRPLLSAVDNVCILFTRLVNKGLRELVGQKSLPLNLVTQSHLVNPTLLLLFLAGAGLYGGPAYGSFKLCWTPSWPSPEFNEWLEIPGVCQQPPLGLAMP